MAKRKGIFTPEELEELRRADAEIEDSYRLTPQDIKESRLRDKQAKHDRLDARAQKIAAQKAAYREANKEKIAAQQAAYREANRGKYNAYMREYMRKRRGKSCTEPVPVAVQT